MPEAVLDDRGDVMFLICLRSGFQTAHTTLEISTASLTGCAGDEPFVWTTIIVVCRAIMRVCARRGQRIVFAYSGGNGGAKTFH